MPVQNRGPIDMLDQMYTVAYWMTGSLKKTNELVYKTYQQVDSGSNEVQLFKIFRKVYYEHFNADKFSLESHCTSENPVNFESENDNSEADGRLALLFAEVCKIKHRTLSIILDMPVDMIRKLLTSERKSMLLKFLNLALACCMPPCYA
jgi:hypothetical protein